MQGGMALLSWRYVIHKQNVCDTGHSTSTRYFAQITGAFVSNTILKTDIFQDIQSLPAEAYRSGHAPCRRDIFIFLFTKTQRYSIIMTPDKVLFGVCFL